MQLSAMNFSRSSSTPVNAAIIKLHLAKQICKSYGRFSCGNPIPAGSCKNYCKCHKTKICLVLACGPISHVFWHCLFWQTWQSKQCTQTHHQLLFSEHNHFLNLEKHLKDENSSPNLKLDSQIVLMSNRSMVCHSILRGEYFFTLITLVSESIWEVF